eukprot:gene10664-13062_t
MTLNENFRVVGSNVFHGVHATTPEQKMEMYLHPLNRMVQNIHNNNNWQFVPNKIQILVSRIQTGNEEDPDWKYLQQMFQTLRTFTIGNLETIHVDLLVNNEQYTSQLIQFIKDHSNTLTTIRISAHKDVASHFIGEILDHMPFQQNITSLDLKFITMYHLQQLAKFQRLTHLGIESIYDSKTPSYPNITSPSLASVLTGLFSSIPALRSFKNQRDPTILYSVKSIPRITEISTLPPLTGPFLPDQDYFQKNIKSLTLSGTSMEKITVDWKLCFPVLEKLVIINGVATHKWDKAFFKFLKETETLTYLSVQYTPTIIIIQPLLENMIHFKTIKYLDINYIDQSNEVNDKIISSINHHPSLIQFNLEYKGFVAKLMNDFTSKSIFVDSIPIREHFILLQIYKDTNGDHWKNNQIWQSYYEQLVNVDNMAHFMNLRKQPNYRIWDFLENLDSNQTLINLINTCLNSKKINICDAYGVTCTNDKISSLQLSQNNLIGELSEYISFFISIKNIDLSGNQLSGNLPMRILSMNSLETLNISHNYISGELNFINAPNLIILCLNNNRLLGYIPKSWKTPKLYKVDLSHNKFSGTIPKSLFRAKNLDKVDVSSNFFVGYLPTLSQSSISFFNFSNNKIMDNITYSSIWKAGNLKNVDGDNNLLEGYLPRSMLDYSPLRNISLKGNNILGEVPSVVSCFSGVTIRLQNPHQPCKPVIYSTPLLDPSGGTVTINGNDFGIHNSLIDIKFEDGSNCSNVSLLKANTMFLCNNSPGNKGSVMKLTFFNNNTTEKGGTLTIQGRHFYNFKNQINVTVGDEQCQEPTIDRNSNQTIFCKIRPNSTIRIPANVVVSLDQVQINNPSVFYFSEIYYQDISSSFPPSRAYSEIITITSKTLDFSKGSLEVKVGQNLCTNITILNSSAITCIPHNTSGTNIRVSITMDEKITYYNNGLSYPIPVIDSASGVSLQKGGIVHIRGRHLKGKRRNVQISIGDRDCCPLVDEIENHIQCYLPPTTRRDIILNQPVSITVSNQTSDVKYIFSDFDGSCLEPCVIHGTRDCRSGLCDCYPNFSGPFCEKDIPETLITFNSTNPAFIFRYHEYMSTQSFLVSFNQLQEINERGDIVKTFNIQKDWNLLYNSPTRSIYSAIVQNGNHARSESTVNVTVYYRTNHSEIYYSGEIIQLPKYTVRYSIKIDEWQFQSKSNSLRIIFHVNTPNKTEVSPCFPKTQVTRSSGPKLRWFTMTNNDIILFSRVTQRVMMNGLVRYTQATINETNDFSTYTLNYALPSFHENLTFETDFSTMVESYPMFPSDSQGCFVLKKQSTVKYSIVFSVYALVILSSVVFIIKCSRIDSRERKKQVKYQALQHCHSHNRTILPPPTPSYHKTFNILEIPPSSPSSSLSSSPKTSFDQPEF